MSMIPQPTDCGAPCAVCEAYAHQAANLKHIIDRMNISYCDASRELLRLKYALDKLHSLSPCVIWRGSDKDSHGQLVPIVEITKCDADGLHTLIDEYGNPVRLGYGTTLLTAIEDAEETTE